MSVRLRTILAITLGSVASAGLFASTSNDLQDLTPLYISDIWLLPGLIFIGALISWAINDMARSTLALVVVGVLGSLLYGSAIAAPAARVEAASTTFIDRGTQQGLIALLLIPLFGLAGIAVTWVVGALVQGIRERS